MTATETVLTLALVVAGFAFPYHRMPHTWRAVFTTQWWRR